MTDSKKAQAVGALRKCAKEHEKDFTPTFNIRVSDLCSDVADYLEELKKENGELKEKLDVFEDMVADMCTTDNPVLFDYLRRILKKYGKIV